MHTTGGAPDATKWFATKILNKIYS